MPSGTTRLFPQRSRPPAFSLSLCLAKAWVFMAALALITVCAPPQSTGQAAEHLRVRGTVRDSAGTPIATAFVSLQQENVHLETRTEQDGNFTFADVQPGTFKVQAEKPGYCTLVTDFVPSERSGPLSLVLTKLENGGRNCAAATATPNLNVELDDKPSFTIAGIKDWSGAGGHGSDTTLPTSETLTKHTLAMKSEQGIQPCPADRERELRSAVTDSPASFAANHQLGIFYLACNRVGDAIGFLESASRINADDRDNALQLASAYQQTGDLSRARAQLVNLLAIAESGDAHRLLGDIDEAQNDSLSAVHEYERATHLDPSEQNYFAWGTELLLHRAVQPAIEVFSKSIRAHPNSSRLLAGLGAALYAGGAYDEAAKRVCAASELNPADDGPYLFLGTMQKSVHQTLPCALEKLARFAEQKPENALANYYYAIALWKKSRRTPDGADAARAESSLKKAVVLDPKLAGPYLQLGMLYAAQNKTDAAIAAFQKAISAEANLSEAHYELGLAYKRLGKDADARREFQTYAEVQKANTEAAEKRRREVRQFVIALADRPAAAAPR